MTSFLQIAVVACLAIAAVSGQHPQETPEVAQAKAEHFRAYSAALAAAGGHDNNNNNYNNNNNNNGQYQPQPQYHQQPQQQQYPQYQPQNPFQPNSDTPEVAQAKAEHFRLVNAALAQVGGQQQQQQHQHQPQQQYQPQPQQYHHQPQPSPYQAQSGLTNQDTAEVAQAKAEHFRAHQAAIARANEISRSDTDSNNNGQYQPQQQYQQQQQQPQQFQQYQPQPNSLGHNNFNPFQPAQPQPFYNPGAVNGNRAGQVSVSQQNGGFTYNYATGN